MQYSVTGTAKPGQNFVPVTGTVLLRAGQTTASIPILTLNDDVTFQPTDIITGTWPTRVGTVEVKEGDVTVPGKPLFSLTETGFTVTLRASAADRTKLKVGQTTTVQLQGGTGTAPGVISELDDTATTDQTTKTQVYEGKVQVQGDLGAADGAPVTIKVVLQEHLNALTVPIAAVQAERRGPGHRAGDRPAARWEDHRGPGEDGAVRGFVHRDPVRPQGQRGRGRRARQGLVTRA